MHKLLVWLALPACGFYFGDERDDCLQGVCPKYDRTQQFPGPCATGTNDELSQRTEYTYDERARLVRVGARTIRDVEQPTSYFFNGSSYTYDGDAREPSTITFESAFVTSDSTMTITADGAATVGPEWGTRTYDADFVLQPRVGTIAMQPDAHLGLIRDGDKTFTWTKAGTTWTRVDDATGERRIHELDERGRLRTVTRDGLVIGQYDYEGELLVHQRRFVRTFTILPNEITWTYDAVGNVIEGVSPDGYREVYEYDCW